MYNIVLTKAAILHKSYLNEYVKVIPKEFLQFIDNNRNCEDLAMQYVVSVQVYSTISYHILLFCR